MERTQRTDAYWDAFRRATGVGAADYDVSRFDDSAEVCDELTALVLSGVKRATASLLRDYETAGKPAPAAGDYVVSVDFAGEPRLIWRNTRVEIKPMTAITAADARDEGEGDGSLAYWLEVHRRYWTRQAEHEGFAFTDDMQVVFERFEVVWPAQDG